MYNYRVWILNFSVECGFRLTFLAFTTTLLAPWPKTTTIVFRETGNRFLLMGVHPILLGSS